MNIPRLPSKTRFSCRLLRFSYFFCQPHVSTKYIFVNTSYPQGFPSVYDFKTEPLPEPRQHKYGIQTRDHTPCPTCRRVCVCCLLRFEWQTFPILVRSQGSKSLQFLISSQSLTSQLRLKDLREERGRPRPFFGIATPTTDLVSKASKFFKVAEPLNNCWGFKWN